MNKKILTKSVWCLALCLTLTACSEEDSHSTDEGTPLQVELQGVLPTRAAITASTLPDGSQYGIYVAPYGQIVKRGDNGYNIPVKYNGGKSVMGRDYILQPGTDYSVYAAYPEKNSSDVMTLPLETASQTDYLYGCAVNGNGEQAVINQSNHVAKIQLSHALALLRFNISQSAENHEQNKVTAIETFEMPITAILDIKTGQLTNQKYGTNRINCQFTASVNSHTVEMLVLPCDWLKLSFEVNNKNLYASSHQVLKAGNSYMFDVEIRSDATIQISDPIIIPRENGETKNITMPLN